MLGAAVGPAAGGMLTDLLSWEAMFALQAPVALVGLAGSSGMRPRRAARSGARRPAPAGARVAALRRWRSRSAALAAALFLLVTMIIEGWRHSPIEAALIVTVMPVSAMLAPTLARLVGADDVVPRAAAGAVLLAGGLAGLGLLPGSSPAWTILPQILIGLGSGCCSPG